ncbi:MAG: hypothetical protein GXY20_02310 [Clostridiales bacterium]|nr:hypothetical protein [Clostridiales bacterium]
MSSRRKYNTRQRESLISFFKNHPDEVFSARELIADNALNVGEATVYRLLAGLSREGILKKLPADNGGASRYRLSSSSPLKAFCLLKCVRCGETVSASCSVLGELERHIGDDHGFYMSPEKPIFYGVCGVCHEDKSRLK